MEQDIIAHPLRGLPVRGRQAWRRLLAAVPSDCPACGGAARGGLFCPGCVEDAVLGMAPATPRCEGCALRLGAAGMSCPACRLQPPAYASTRAALDYAPPYDSLVVRFKNHHQFILGRALAGLMRQALQSGPPLPGGPVQALVAVPSSRASLRRRGFNPAGELASILSRSLGVPRLHGALLRRHEAGVRQATLGREARRAAALDRYVCRASLLGAHVALVDDVMTTGSTAEAASLALLAAGASRVSVLVVARTPAPALAQ